MTFLFQEFYVSYGDSFYSLSPSSLSPIFKTFFTWSTGEYLYCILMTTNPSSQPPPTTRGAAAGPIRPGQRRVPRWRTSQQLQPQQSQATIIIVLQWIVIQSLFSHYNLSINLCYRLVCPFDLLVRNKTMNKKPV